jgi:hypothetical protein
VLKEEERERLVDNIGSHLCNAQEFIQVINFVYTVKSDRTIKSDSQ